MSTCPSGVHYIASGGPCARPYPRDLQAPAVRSAEPRSARRHPALSRTVSASPGRGGAGQAGGAGAGSIKPLRPMAAMLRLAPGFPKGRAPSEMPGTHPPPAPAGAGGAAGRMRPAGAAAEIDEAAIACSTDSRWRWCGWRRKAAAARWLVHTWAARSRRWPRRGPMWMPDGRDRGRGAGCHPRHRVRPAAPPSRTMAIYAAPRPVYAEKARRVSALAKDISEYVATLGLPKGERPMGPQGRLSRRLLAPAWAEDQGAAGAIAAQCRLRGWRSRRKAISAAARPAPTTCSRATSPCSCVTARWPISRSWPQHHRRRQYRCMTQIGSGTGLPVVIRWNCWIGPRRAGVAAPWPPAGFPPPLTQPPGIVAGPA